MPWQISGDEMKATLIDWSGSLDAFANMYNLRSKPDTQEETRLIANEIGGIMTTVYPHSWKALTDVH